MHRVYVGVSIAIVVWTAFAVFALAFQCGSTRPWVYTPERCSNRGAIWFPIIIFNFLSDAVLAFLFAPTLWTLNMARTQRMTVIALFSVRTLYRTCHPLFGHDY
jgi:hypothetical protein